MWNDRTLLPARLDLCSCKKEREREIKYGDLVHVPFSFREFTASSFKFVLILFITSLYPHKTVCETLKQILLNFMLQ